MPKKLLPENCDEIFRCSVKPQSEATSGSLNMSSDTSDVINDRAENPDLETTSDGILPITNTDDTSRNSPEIPRKLSAGKPIITRCSSLSHSRVDPPRHLLKAQSFTLGLMKLDESCESPKHLVKVRTMSSSQSQSVARPRAQLAHDQALLPNHDEEEVFDEAKRCATKLEAEDFAAECADLESLMENIAHNAHSFDPVELYHTYDCRSSFQHMSEVLKIIVGDVSVSALVTGASVELSKNEVALLKDMEQYSNKEVIIGTDSYSDNLNISALKNSLVDKDKCVKCEMSSKLIEYASSLTSSMTIPLLWYVFGLKLRSIMTKFNCSVIKMSKLDIIAQKLHMDRPMVEAVLEYLTEQKVLLYFRNILSNIVFSGVNVFSEIFAILHGLTCSRKEWKKAVISQEELSNLIENYAGENISAHDYIKLFRELMILANFDHAGANFILPCLLHPLEESCTDPVRDQHSVVFIECPSTGNEYISMLTVFLLSQSNNSWSVSKNSSGDPLMLHKDCVKFYVKTAQCSVTVSFSSKYVCISIPSISELNEADLNEIGSFVMKGLEKIKIILGSHKTFIFRFLYPCMCANHTHTHPAVPLAGALLCSIDGTGISQDCNRSKWQSSLTSGKFV